MLGASDIRIRDERRFLLCACIRTPYIDQGLRMNKIIKIPNGTVFITLVQMRKNLWILRSCGQDPELKISYISYVMSVVFNLEAIKR